MLFLFPIWQSENDIDSLFYLFFQFLFDAHLHDADQLHILGINFKFVIWDIDIAYHWNSSSRKCFDLFFFIVNIPIRILSTTFIFLITFPHRQCDGLLHLSVHPTTINIWFISFSFYFLLVIFFNSFSIVPLLVILIVIKRFFIAQWKSSLDRKNLKPTLFHWD